MYGAMRPTPAAPLVVSIQSVLERLRDCHEWVGTRGGTPSPSV
jgi:hypothetical protein